MKKYEKPKTLFISMSKWTFKIFLQWSFRLTSLYFFMASNKERQKRKRKKEKYISKHTSQAHYLHLYGELLNCIFVFLSCKWLWVKSSAKYIYIYINLDFNSQIYNEFSDLCTSLYFFKTINSQSIHTVNNAVLTCDLASSFTQSANYSFILVLRLFCVYYRWKTAL